MPAMQESAPVDVTIWGLMATGVGLALAIGGFLWHAFGRVHGRIDALGERVSAVETDVRHLPTQDDFDGLRGDIGRLNSTMSGIQAHLEAERQTSVGTRQRLDEIYRFLLAQGGKSG